MMGVQMALLYAREQHDEARKTLVQFPVAHQLDLGDMFSGTTGNSLSETLKELRKIGKKVNSRIHPFCHNQGGTLGNFGVHHLPYDARESSARASAAIPAMSRCAGSNFEHVLGVSTEQELNQKYNTDDRNLGDILDNYSKQSTLDNSETLKSIKLDWVPCWDKKHWGMVVAIGKSQGFCVPMDELFFLFLFLFLFYNNGERAARGGPWCTACSGRFKSIRDRKHYDKGEEPKPAKRNEVTEEESETAGRREHKTSDRKCSTQNRL